LHFALCTLHFALCTLHFALCTLHFALCTLHYPFRILHSVFLFAINPVHRVSRAAVLAPAFMPCRYPHLQGVLVREGATAGLPSSAFHADRGTAGQASSGTLRRQPNAAWVDI